MSNVLIGIIGVILFIGLALAGALFLGPRFQEATISSKVSAWSQGQAQIAQAVNMREVTEGAKVQAQTDTAAMTEALVKPGFMKTIPVNPVGADRYYVLRGPNGDFSGNATYVMNGFYATSTIDVKMCVEIARQAGLALDADGSPPTLTAPVGRTGCFRNKSGWGADDESILWAYTRI